MQCAQIQTYHFHMIYVGFFVISAAVHCDRFDVLSIWPIWTSDMGISFAATLDYTPQNGTGSEYEPLVRIRGEAKRF